MSEERFDREGSAPAPAPAPASAAPGETRSFFPDKPLWTPEIERKAMMVADWVSCDLEGSHIWGIQRIGKSEFAKYLLDVINAMLEGSTAAVVWSFLGIKPKNADQLLKRCLVDMGSTAISTRETMVLQARLVSLVAAKCRAMGARRVLIIVDEMQNISHELYPVLMAVTGDLRKAGLLPHLLSIGQPEMQTTIDLVFQNNYQQIIGRFFQRTETYLGLSLQDVGLLLANMDGEAHEFTVEHFASRAREGWSIVDLMGPIGQAVEAMMAARNINNAQARLPLGYLRPALNCMFRMLSDDPRLVIDAATAQNCFQFTGLHRVIGHYVEYTQEAAHG